MSVEKAKQATSNFMHKASQTFARTKQMVLFIFFHKKNFFFFKKAMAKMGKAEETVDIQFNQERDRFFIQYKAIKKLKKDVLKMMDLLKGKFFLLNMF